jgi:hypothetical protein
MQPCEFSETQFSFCFTFEYLKNFFPTVPLPLFPNIRQEGAIGGGYDVKINGNLYFQFKIPNLYDRENNYTRKYWKVYNHEYYKIKLETDSNQYRFLKNLISPYNLIYYATPEFHSVADLTLHYNADMIGNNSALFSIENLPPHGSGYHHLIYSPREHLGQLFSTPEPIKKNLLLFPGEYFRNENRDLTLYQQALNIRELLLQYNVIGDLSLSSNEPAILVKQVYTILLTNFNIHWVPLFR